MSITIRFNEEKNELLKATREVCFEDVIEAIQQKKLVADLEHPKAKFPHQKVLVVVIKKYVYAVPYVFSIKKQEMFLKTIYPSRVLTKQYIKEGKYE